MLFRTRLRRVLPWVPGVWIIVMFLYGGWAFTGQHGTLATWIGLGLLSPIILAFGLGLVAGALWVVSTVGKIADWLGNFLFGWLVDWLSSKSRDPMS